MKKALLLLSTAVTVVLVPSVASAQDVTTPGVATQVSNEGEANVENPVGNDVIIVTARRRAEDVSKVPISVTAFSGEQLTAKGVTNTYDLTKITPGLNISAGGGKANPFVVLRGQSKAVTGNGSPGVITYLNDVPLPGYGSAIQTYDMENIQVLKGPQGTLFGRNSLGGALLTVTRGPTHEFNGYVNFDVASNNFRQLEAAVNVPLVKDVVALRLATQISDDDGDVKTFAYTGYTLNNPSPGVYNAVPGQLNPRAWNNDQFRVRSYRASLLIEPTDWLKNVTVGDYSSIRGQNNQTFDRAYPTGLNGGNPALYYLPPAVIANALTNPNDPNSAFFANTYASIVQNLAQCPSGAVNCNVFSAIDAAQGSAGARFNYVTQDPGLARTIIKGISNTTTIRLGEDHQIKNIFAIRTTDSFSNTTLTGLAVPIITTANQVRLKQTTEELQLSGDFLDKTLKYTVGGFYYNERPNGPGGYQALEVNSFFGLSHTLGVTQLRNTSKAIYGQVDYSPDFILPGLTLTAGLRQTWDTQSACTTNVTFSPLQPGPGMVLTSPDNAAVIPTEAQCQAGVGPNVANRQVFPDANFKKLTYTLGANWQITPDAMIYVTHRRGYRAGGYNTPQIDPYLSSLQTFRPETLTDWEAGAKLRFESGDMRGSLDVAVFSGKAIDAQIPITTSQLSGSSATCVPQALGTPGHPNDPTDALYCLVNGNGAPGSRVPINGATTTVNAGELSIRGFEAAATFSPIRALTFGGSLSLVDVKANSIVIDPRFAQVLPAVRVPTAANFAAQGQPRWTANASIAFNYPTDVLGGQFSASIDYHYNDTYRSVELTVPATHQFDLRVALEDIGGTGLSAAGYVRNLTNETTYIGTGSSSPSGIGAQSFVIGRARQIGLQLGYKFGNR